MKKFLIVLSLVITTVSMCYSQKVYEYEEKTLKTTDLGNQKLVVKDYAGEHHYFIRLKPLRDPNRSIIVVELGETEQALHILQFLDDLKIKGDNMIDLENPSCNTARWSGGINKCFFIYEDGTGRYGHVRKPHLKKYIEAIKDYENEN